MVTTLTFIKSDDGYIANFTSTGLCVIEMERDKSSLISVRANIEGMESVPMAVFKNEYSANAIFEVNVPSGIEVTIKSATEVANAKMLS